MPFTVTTTVLSVTVCFNQMRSVNFNTETIKLVILRRQAFGQQRVKQPSGYLAVDPLCGYLTGTVISLLYWVAQNNVPNFRMALRNTVDEVNQQKSMYVMSKHLRICL